MQIATRGARGQRLGRVGERDRRELAPRRRRPQPRAQARARPAAVPRARSPPGPRIRCGSRRRRSACSSVQPRHPERAQRLLLAVDQQHERLDRLAGREAGAADEQRGARADRQLGGDGCVEATRRSGKARPSLGDRCRQLPCPADRPSRSARQRSLPAQPPAPAAPRTSRRWLKHYHGERLAALDAALRGRQRDARAVPRPRPRRCWALLLTQEYDRYPAHPRGAARACPRRAPDAAGTAPAARRWPPRAPRSTAACCARYGSARARARSRDGARARLRLRLGPAHAVPGPRRRARAPVRLRPGRGDPRRRAATTGVPATLARSDFLPERLPFDEPFDLAYRVLGVHAPVRGGARALPDRAARRRWPRRHPRRHGPAAGVPRRVPADGVRSAARAGEPVRLRAALRRPVASAVRGRRDALRRDRDRRCRTCASAGALVRAARTSTCCSATCTRSC